MKEGLDINLLRSGDLMRKGYSFLIANLGKTIALITLAIVVLVSFAEISFSDIGKENLTSTLIVMLICSSKLFPGILKREIHNIRADQHYYKC